MKKKLLVGMAMLLCIGSLFTGCSGQAADDYDGEEQVDEELLAHLREEPWDAYEKTENVNPDMESISPFDVVDDMRVGWNLGNSMESTNNNLIRVEKPFKFERAWGNPPTTKEMIDEVLAAGFNVIRVPITWYQHCDPELNIEESWMNRVQEVVDYAYSQGAYVIINVHHENWHEPYYENLDKALFGERKIWAQIAERFKDYDEHLIFESLNEPRKIGTPVEWNGGDEEGREVVNLINAECVKAVRNSGGSNPYRMIMLPTYAASSTTTAMEAWKAPEGDDRIIVSIHAYTPYNFALNIADGAKLNWNNDTAGIDQMISDAKRLYLDNGYPVIIGEFGAVSRDDETERRIEWVHYYLQSANAYGIPCIVWDNNNYKKSGERLGLFDRENLSWPYPEYLQAIMEETASRAPEGAFLFNAEEYRAAHPVQAEETDSVSENEAE